MTSESLSASTARRSQFEDKGEESSYFAEEGQPQIPQPN